MNRKNKAKKQEKIEEPSASENWDINPGYVIGGLGLAIAAGSLYLQWKSNKFRTPGFTCAAGRRAS